MPEWELLRRLDFSPVHSGSTWRRHLECTAMPHRRHVSSDLSGAQTFCPHESQGDGVANCLSLKSWARSGAGLAALSVTGPSADMNSYSRPSTASKHAFSALATAALRSSSPMDRSSTTRFSQTSSASPRPRFSAYCTHRARNAFRSCPRAVSGEQL